MTVTLLLKLKYREEESTPSGIMVCGLAVAGQSRYTGSIGVRLAKSGAGGVGFESRSASLAGQYMPPGLNTSPRPSPKAGAARRRPATTRLPARWRRRGDPIGSVHRLIDASQGHGIPRAELY